MPKLILDKDKICDEYGLPFESFVDNVEIISDKITDNSRWSIHHHLIVRIDDKFYETSYSVGATESQDESPWEYEDEVEFTEIRKVTKMVEVWEPVQ